MLQFDILHTAVCHLHRKLFTSSLKLIIILAKCYYTEFVQKVFKCSDTQYTRWRTERFDIWNVFICQRLQELRSLKIIFGTFFAWYLLFWSRLTYDEAVDILRKHNSQLQNEASVSCFADLNMFLWIFHEFMFSCVMLWLHVK